MVNAFPSKIRMAPMPRPLPPNPWQMPEMGQEASNRPVKSEIASTAGFEVRYSTTPDPLSNPTYRCCDVAASRVTAELDGSLNWVSIASPAPFGATRLQSPGVHCVPDDGAHDQSWGPSTVLRAPKRRPPKLAIAGTARSAGCRFHVFPVVIAGLPWKAGAFGVASAQSEQAAAVHCDGAGLLVIAKPFAFAR